MRHPVPSIALLTALALPGCKSEAPTASDQLAFSSFASSAWSAPVSLGPVINSAVSDQNATLSKDGLTLYFSSNRTGNLDIYVSHRPTTADEWGTPQSLTALNTSAGELAPNLSVDGHLLFFSSNRAGSTPTVPGGAVPSIDIWMSSRTDPQNDFSWGPPVRLGPGVNTASADQAPMYLQNAEEGTTNFYFNRGVLAENLGDIYSASVTRDGRTLGDAEAVTELNSLANDAAVSLRQDGREIIFWSLRAGSAGQDLYSSTRPSIHHEWSVPEKLDAPLNSAANDLTPSLSFDGRTLIFSSNRSGEGTSGGNDLYMATRTPSGR